MPGDDLKQELAALKNRINELESTNEANEAFKRALDDRPFGLDRLRGVKRKEGLPQDYEEDDD